MPSVYSASTLIDISKFFKYSKLPYRMPTRLNGSKEVAIKMSKDNNKIQSLRLNILALRGLVENLRENPKSIKSITPAISSKLRLLVQIPSIHSLQSADNTSSIYSAFNVISRFVAMANKRNGWGIISDCNIYVINQVVLFNELMDDIVAGKLNVDTFLNPEFIDYLIKFPLFYPSIDPKAYKEATRTIARELLTKLCSPEEENTSGFNVPFDTSNITDAANFLIEKAQHVRSKAIKDLGFDIDELLIVPELSKLDFSHTILRRSITRMYLDRAKDNSMPISPFKRVNSYPQDGKKLSELRI